MAAEKSKNIFDNSKEGTIGARIRVLLAETGHNVTTLEEAGGVGNGTLKTWKDKPIDFSTTIVKNFRSNLSINPNWWEHEEGPVFIAGSKENGTHDDNRTDNKGNGKESALKAAYQTVVDGATEYVLIPLKILDKTQLVSIDEMERKNGQIDFYQNQIAKLLEGMELAAKPTKSKKGKE